MQTSNRRAGLVTMVGLAMGIMLTPTAPTWATRPVPNGLSPGGVLLPLFVAWRFNS